MLNRYLIFQLLISISVTGVADASAQIQSKNDPEQTFAYQGDVVISQLAMDAAFARIPPKDRLPFIRSGEKVQNLLATLLQTMAIAADGEKAGFASKPVIAARMRLAAAEELAQAWMDEVMKNAPDADYEALAWEDYTANPQNYMTEEKVSVTHLLVTTHTHTAEEAEQIATDLRAKVQADPSAFNAMVLEYSEDPVVHKNKGQYKYIVRGQMTKPFEDAAFGMAVPGEISEIVRTNYGFHIIRLDERYESTKMTFEKAKKDALEKVKKDYLDDYNLKYLQHLGLESITLPEGSVEVMAKKYFGENLELAPFKAD